MAGLHATIGILAALHTRDETGRGQHVEVNLLSSALSGLVNQSSAYVAGGTVPFRMGNSHPSLFPYEPLPCADGDLIITAGNNAPVPQARRGARRARAGRRPAVRPQRGPHRQPRRAAAAAGRAAARPAPTMEWFRDDHRRRRAVRADQHRRRRRRVRRGASASTRSSRSARATRRCRRCATRSRSPRRRRDYRLPPPALDEHGDEIRAWLEESAHERRAAASRPRSAPPTADEIRLLGQDLTADLMGKVGFGELAFWLVAMRRPTPSEVRVFEAVLVALADHGFTPTAIAARLTYLSAPDSLQGALAAGLLGGGSRFLGVTEDCGAYLHAVLDDVDDDLPTDDAGWDALALDAVRRTREAGQVRPRPRPPGAQGRGPAHPGADRDRRGGGPARPAPAAVRGDRPDARAGARPPAAAQRRRRLRRRARRPRPARSSCCAGSRCWPARPGCSGRSPRSAAARSAWTPTSPSTATRSTSTPTDRTDRAGGAGMATGRRGHRLDAPPVLLPREHVDRRRPAAVRGRVGQQDRDLPRDADRGPGPTCW